MYLHFLHMYILCIYNIKQLRYFCMYACTIYFWEDKIASIYDNLKISDIYNFLRYKKIQ